jgi:serine/threonine protein kinase
MTAVPSFLTWILGLFAAVLIGVFAIWILIKCFAVLGAVCRHIGRFVIGMFSDFFRTIGAVVLLFVLVPLTVLNVVIGRWSAAGHYGRAFKNEVKTASTSLYRVVIGHPLRLLGLGGVTEGLEQRLPQVIAEAPGSDKPARRVGMFEGYNIVGSLAGGGSGGKLFIAEPNEVKQASFERQGFGAIDQVVIKSFRLDDGSSLPQIVRESRALDAAKKLGLVLEHDLANDRFFYVMRYVPGESLATLTTRMHGISEAGGLSDHHLRTGLSYMSDLLGALSAYHAGGLWHKDVKPDNIIVDGKKAHLVDFGLITPLRSAMTLTTHGTEYFRDPELVRQALRGAKVHQIDGTKFDVYAAGAVLFSIIENSFPAHGGLSQITKRCPESVRWIVRRAMTDYDKRYTSAGEMLADVRAVLDAHDPFSVRPIDLPSMSGGAMPPLPEHPEPDFAFAAASTVPPPIPPAAAAFAGGHAASPRPVPQRLAGRPSLSLSNWWSGRYDVKGPGVASEHTPSRDPIDSAADRVLASIPPGVYVGGMVAGGRTPAKPVARADRGATPVPPRPPLRPKAERSSAADQLRDARSRAAARRRSAQQRSKTHRSARGRRPNPSGVNAGVVGAVFIFLLAAAAAMGIAVIAPAFTQQAQREQVEEREAAHALAHGSNAVDHAIPVEPLPVQGLAGTSILIVSDLAHPLNPELGEEIFRAVNAMAGSGVELLGDGPMLRRDVESSDESQVSLVAALKARRGQVPVDSSAFFDSVREFLKENPQIDLALWLSPMAADEPGIRVDAMTAESRLSSPLRRDVGENLFKMVLGVELPSITQNAKP